MASAAILVGGSSRRFGGRDKGALVVGGRAILDRQIAELSVLTDDILLVGGRDDGPLRAGTRQVPDRVPGLGPLGGLDTALAEARDDRIIVLACDMPLVSSAFLRQLLSRSDEVDAVVPRTKRGYHPLCAVYARTCHAAVLRRLAERQLSMRGLLNDLRVSVVDDGGIETERLLANVNTPADFDELETLLGHKL